MYDNIDYVFPRYDYYTNPVNFTYNGKKINFPYLTVYYKEQGYAEATPLFKALGGSAKYDKKTGILTCKYAGTILVFKDFSKKYTINGEEMSLKYPMRRMQYDLAYVPVKDVCEVLGLEYNIVKKRVIYQYEDIIEYAPKLVEISKTKKELGMGLHTIQDRRAHGNIENANQHTAYNDDPQYDRVYNKDTKSYEWGLAYVSGYTRLDKVETATRECIGGYLNDYGSYLFTPSKYAVTK